MTRFVRKFQSNMLNAFRVTRVLKPRFLTVNVSLVNDFATELFCIDF